MKLIIDIPEEDYKLICSDGRPFLPSYKWIKNGIPLDKIRAEIEEVELNITYEENYKVGGTWGLRKALDIIDKCKTESEVLNADSN